MASSHLEEKLEEKPTHHTTPHHDTNDLQVLTTYRDLSIKYMLNSNPATTNAIAQLPKNLINEIRYHVFCQKHLKTPFYRLAPCSGYFKPGQSTLFLSPPGGGRSSLLKLATESLPPTSGDLLFNGLTSAEAEKIHNIDIKKMISFVDQVDKHFDQLTVYETLEFAHRLLCKEPSRKYLEEILVAFGMEECRNTLNSMCSGGQKRRLSLMLGICNPHAKIVAMDNLSDGLDHATADDIVRYMCNWARVNNSVFLCSLQQPAPSIFNQFDKLVLLRDGFTVYNGPIVDISIYMEAFGYMCPDDIELPEFIIHVLTSPKICLQEIALNQDRLIKVQDELKHLQEDRQHDSTSLGSRRSTIRISRQRPPLRTSLGPLKPSLYPCISTEEMVDYFHTTPFYHDIINVLEQVETKRMEAGLEKTQSMKEREEELLKEEAKLAQFFEGEQPATPTTPISPRPIVEDEPLELLPISTPSTKSYYEPGYTVPILQLFIIVLNRQLKLTSRNRTQLISRIIPAFTIAFIFSGLYFNLNLDAYSFRVASFMDINTELAYNNLLELGLFIHYRQLIHSQLNLYPTYVYTFAVQLAGIPFAMVESFILTVIPYAMIGNTPYGLSMVNHYFMLLFHSFVMTAIFRAGASITSNTSMAYAVVSPVVCVLSLSSGFFVRVGQLWGPLKLIYYISPFAFVFRSMSLLEFLSPRYDYLIPTPEDSSVLGRAGNIYLQLNGISENPAWILISVFYFVGVVILLVLFSSYFLYAPHKEYSIGTRRFALNEEEDEIFFDIDEQIHLDEQDQDDLELLQKHQLVLDNNDVNSDYPHMISQVHTVSYQSTTLGVEMSSTGVSRTHQASRSRFPGGNNKLDALTNSLPFTPATLAFENIKFTVKALDDDKKSYDRILLQNVTGFARSGTLSMLAGSSGAGKTTLLNTLMGLNKTTSTSRVDGGIYVNGVEVGSNGMSISQFTSITGYVEQFDTLYPFDTVYETLLFSAKARLRNANDDILQNVVLEVMDVLELTMAKDLIIGSPDNPVLSPSQRKRVSIGVELVANPSILFCDEPTTGLDSESAGSVVRCLSKIARSGRSVICTIHQPSSQLFYTFDNLILLGSGGFQLYSGRLGRRARIMIQHFSKLPGFGKFPRRVNPAEYLVEQVSQPLPSQVATQAKEKFQQYQKVINDNLSTMGMFAPIASEDFDSLSPKQQWIRFLHVSYLSSSLNTSSLHFLRTTLPHSTAIIDLENIHNTIMDTTTSKDQATHRITSDKSIHQSKDNTVMKTTGGAINDTSVPNKSYVLPIYKQFFLLARRTAHLYTRSSSFFYTRILSAGLLSAFFALYYRKITIREPAQLLTFLSATILSIGNTAFIMASTALPVYLSMKPIFYREIFSNYYQSLLFPLSFILNEVIWAIPLSIFCFMPHYFAIGASTDVLVFFSYWLTVVVLVLLYTQFSLALSMALPSKITETVQNMCVSLAFSFGNISITYPQTNKIMRFIMRGLLPIYYVNRAITTQQFKDSTQLISVYIDDTPQMMPLKEYVALFTGYHFDGQVYGWSILWLAVMIMTFVTVSLFGAKFVRFR